MKILLDAVSSQGGWTVAIVGILVVFVALYLLTLVFKLIPFLMNLKLRNQLRKEGKMDIAKKRNPDNRCRYKHGYINGFVLVSCRKS